MKWWKVGLLASIGWLLVVVVVAGCLLWNIAAHPMGEAVDDARDEKAGEVAGMLLGGGLVMIWAYAGIQLRKRAQG